MRKILITSIIVLLLCSTLAVIVQASAPITSIAGVNIISSTKINNSTFDNLTVNESMAVAQTAINNYLSGKTKTLVIPGGTIIGLSQTLPANLIPTMSPAASLPTTQLDEPIITAQAPLSQVSPLYTLTRRLPCSGDKLGTPYVNTYVGSGGTPNYGLDVSAVDATFNYVYPNTLSYMGHPGEELLVLHLWGNNQSGGGTSENDIVATRDATNQNMINFYYYEGITYKGLIAQVLQTDKITAYITAMNPIGSSNYNQLQVCVYDATTKTWFRPSETDMKPLEFPIKANSGDVALECTNYYTQNLNDWKVAENVIEYDISQGQENQFAYGHVAYWFAPNASSPYAQSAYYFDPWTYI